MFTSNHILQKLFICVASLKLRLPAMVMCVYEARTDDLVGAVNNSYIVAFLDGRSNLCDRSVLDQQVELGRNHVVVGVVDEDHPILE